MNRDKWTQYCAIAAFGCFATLAGNSIAGVPDTEWTSRFGGVTAGVQASPDDRPRLMAGPSGQTFAYGFVESGLGEPGVVRFSGNITTPNWSAIDSFDHGEGTNQAQLFPLSDGSSIHLSAALVRFAPDGNLAWSIPKDDLAAVTLLPSGDLLAAFSGKPGWDDGMLRVLSATTGITLDALRVGGGCSDLKLTSFAPDIVYLWTGCSSRQVTRLRVNPLRIEWTSAAYEPMGSIVDGMVADASGVYIVGSNQLRKLSSATGQTAWVAAPVSGDFNNLATDGAGNVVTSGSGIDSWNGTTGSNLWHYSEIAVMTVDPALNAVFFSGSLPRTTPSDAYVGLAGRLDLANGNVVWRHEMPSGSSVRFTDSAVAGNALQLIGLACLDPQIGPCATKLWSTDAATGNTFQSAPLVSKNGISGAAILEEGDQTLAAAMEWTSAGPQIHLRRYMNATGTILQESVTPFQFAPPPWPSNQRLNVVRSSDGNIVATFGNSGTGGASYSFFDATIIKIEVATGQLLWQKLLIDTAIFQRAASISTPAVDADGNITLGVLEQYLLDFPNRRWVRKFNHISGDLMWERELPADPMSASSNITPAVFALGTDVMSETPLGETGTGWTSLSGADGTTRWRNPLITGRIQVLDMDTAISFGPETSQIVARRFNMTTGSILWTATYSDLSDISYSVSGGVRGSQDDFYVGGTHRLASLISNGLLFRINLTTGGIVWANHLTQGPVGPGSQVNPRFVHDGKVFATQPFFHTYGYALSAFSIVDGAHTGSAFLYSSPLEQPHLPQHADSGVMGKSAAGDLMIVGHHSDPGLPTEFMIANWGNPLPGPNGALRVTLDLEAAGASTAITYAFAFETINDGSVTANDVQALLSLPAGTKVESMSCQLSGSPCAAVMTATSIEGKFTIPVGATLRIEGTASLVPTLDPLGPQSFVASAFAPHPFAELDLKDNVASAPIVELIFRDSFED